MPNRAKSPQKSDTNSDVSEYVWDIKTKHYKRNPNYRADRIATRYIFYAVMILVMLIAIVWCLRWV
jgi:hypothetical protein